MGSVYWQNAGELRKMLTNTMGSANCEAKEADGSQTRVASSWRRTLANTVICSTMFTAAGCRQVVSAVIAKFMAMLQVTGKTSKEALG